MLKAADYDLKQQAQQSAEINAKMASQSGEAMGLCAEPKRANLRQRCYDSQFRAERESRKAGLMYELGQLLDKNPEVARILDLIKEVGR